MRILLTLTYYRPNVSGLTISVERLAHGLVARGHEVTVLAARTAPELPEMEVAGGVRVVRAPVALRVGKAAVMPAYPRIASELLAWADVANPHLPQLEAPVLSVLARRAGCPIVATYACDVRLPPGALNRLADAGALAANAAVVAAADRVVALTEDYARHSPVLRRVGAKLAVVPPVVTVKPPAADDVADFRRRHGLEGRRPVIGMAGRLAAEKGVETLVAALPALVERFPGVTVAFAGPHEGVLGESAYRERILRMLRGHGDRWRFLGVLDDREMPAFMAGLDCLVVASRNSTEAFGMVQVEAMLCGTPVVSTDLPGVREVVLTTGMGEIVTPGAWRPLADAVGRVVEDRAAYVRPPAAIERAFGGEAAVGAYEALFERAVARGHRRGRR